LPAPAGQSQNVEFCPADAIMSHLVTIGSSDPWGLRSQDAASGGDVEGKRCQDRLSPGRPAARKRRAIGPVALVLLLMARAGCGRMVR
jgi:hypothetical protein